MVINVVAPPMNYIKIHHGGPVLLKLSLRKKNYFQDI